MKQNKLPLGYIEISKKNLVHNFLSFRKLLPKGMKISAVVKSNAYGHGIEEVVRILNPYADYFQINSVEELERVRQITKKPILVLGYVQKGDIRRALKLKPILSVFNQQALRNINKISGELGIVQRIHLPIDALFGREGFLKDKWEDIFKEVKKCQNVKLIGLYAHFANIEDKGGITHAKKQVAEYHNALRALAEKFGFKNLKTHLSATSGTLAHEIAPYSGKDARPHDIVRIGLGLYGLWPSKHMKKRFGRRIVLKPVLSWKTKVAQVKELPKGYTVGYGLTFITRKKMRVAVIPQGYSDGVSRRLSNNGFVLIKGKRCKILGRTMMNMFVVNIDHVKGVKTEDEVVIIGRQGGAEIPIEEMAERIERINYEVVARLNPLLPKIVKN